MNFRIARFTEWSRGLEQFKETPSAAHPEFELTPLLGGRPFSNPVGIVKFQGEQLFKQTLSFPVIASINNIDVGWANIYNISHSTVRFQSILVHPQFRRQGVGQRLIEYALGLWPPPWREWILFARPQSVNYFVRILGMNPCPNMMPFCEQVYPLGFGEPITLLKKIFR